jgi:hypothetical protein
MERCIGLDLVGKKAGAASRWICTHNLMYVGEVFVVYFNTKSFSSTKNQFRGFDVSMESSIDKLSVDETHVRTAGHGDGGEER